MPFTVAKVVAVVAVVVAGPASAAIRLAQTAPIKGADVMGDKNRSGPDGWVQAPISRDQAPQLTTKAAGESAAPAVISPPPSHKQMTPGDDPGTAVANPGTGPGKANPPPN